MRLLRALAASGLLLLAALPFPARLRGDQADSDLLRRQSQELLDAITAGNAAVWDRYLDPAAIYVDESGKVNSKKDMVDGVKPLPEGISGVIRVENFQASVHGDVAVTTEIDDEHETFHGHALHCQYRTTSAWRKTKDGWRLVAGQVLALRTDPPAAKLPAAKLAEYVGRYALTPAMTYEIRRRGDGLEGQQTGRKPEELRAEAPDVLFVPGKPRYRFVFSRDGAGRVSGFAERREAWDLVWKKRS
jgi:ketosteroid isomerase-like protein